MGRRLLLLGLMEMASFAGCAGDGQGLNQPVAFDHRQHVHGYEIGCTYCHVSAEHAAFAGIPSVASCWACHRFVSPDKPEVRRISEALNSAEPIAWARLQQLPDHTRFSHQAHLAAGTTCQLCHGPVQEMKQVRAVRAFRMGWCVDCHRKRQGSTDCVACHR